jgi:hypothetical protein
MTTTLWIVLGISVIVVVGFAAAMRSILRENKAIDKNIDYTKVRPWVDDEDEDDK